ncbi:EAL domain-containing protein [Sulfurovum sp.]|uniref:sensor domain-containing protein n=1 Tax=Sulfurovum sp. TaxID=1969726 RepID=UPI0025DC0D14|nr:EAL domain-containing protein [Sulfurovum sp.]
MNHTETEDNDLSQAIDNTDISFKERLTYDKLSFYYISLPIMLLGNLMGAMLLSAIQLNVADLYSIGIWLLISVIMFLYGLYQYSIFKNETEENKLKNSEIWFDKYYTIILLNGIVWGSSAFLLFPESSLLNQMIVIFFLFAIGFLALGILASKRDLLLTYILVTYVPILLRLFFMENEVYMTIGYTMLALILIMILIANYYGKVINNALSNRQHFITIKHTHEKLKERFFSLFERAPVGIYYYNESLELEDINMHFMQMNKIEDKNDLIGINLHRLENKQIIKAHEEVFAGKTGNYRGPFEALHKENLYVKLSTVPMINADGKVAGGISIINDITNEVTAKEKMIRNAYYDLLTNIPNRTLLMDKLKEFISSIRDNEEYAALLFLDINNFKKVNETFGHDVGDSLLKQVVKRLEDVVGSREVLARVSGDKFVILIPSLHRDKTLSKEMTVKYISTINNHFMQPLNVAGEEYHLTFTIGVVLFNNSDASAFDLLKKAETAMYEAKRNARGTSQFYTSSMSNDTKEQLMLENDIHKAIKNNELSIHYQPQLDVQENKIIGAEALVRWEHPEKGFISPAKFIPIAEESGVIIKLEEWIFDKALSEIKELSQSEYGFNLDHIAINVSTMHFLQPHFVERLMLMVNKHKVKPQWIELEITESGIMRNIEDAIEKIRELKSFGFTFSIDDFGTGYSSLAYLKKLPVDMIKIDQSFIFNMNQNKGDAMIVESVVAIGQKFDLKILAEGVENNATLNYLKIIKCDLYQGNFGYKPMPMKQFMEIL